MIKTPQDEFRVSDVSDLFLQHFIMYCFVLPCYFVIDGLKKVGVKI